MIVWKSLSYDGHNFDLSHLNAFEHTFVQLAEKGKPERQYRTWIRFSHHCLPKIPSLRMTQFFDTVMPKKDDLLMYYVGSFPSSFRVFSKA
jgi:hypothetical protein